PIDRGTSRKRRQGYGLGLAAVSSIVKAHGGKVFVSSEIGRGSCFTVALPYHNNQLPEMLSPADYQSTGRRKILGNRELPDMSGSLVS
ncbi:MAG: HAMP domain-containing histidine kinase, partial [Deltaproteobacteria bacterium]|nr:HAMP domain-containing histidine kinase [Deltaproteobacteria bacterium]